MAIIMMGVVIVAVIVITILAGQVITLKGETFPEKKFRVFAVEEYDPQN